MSVVIHTGYQYSTVQLTDLEFLNYRRKFKCGHFQQYWYCRFENQIFKTFATSSDFIKGPDPIPDPTLNIFSFTV
jgi:hypothetical protein